MHPVLLRWRGVTLYSYPAALALGTVAGMYVQQFVAARLGLDPALASIATLALLFAALAGSRLLFLISDGAFARDRERGLGRSVRAGATMYGGLLAAVPLSMVVLPILRLPFWAFWDTASFTMLAGMVITRAGCFLMGGGAARPRAGALGIRLPNDRGVWTRRIPNQLLEATWGALVLGGAVALWSTRPAPGTIFLYTVCAYASGRALLESARETRDALRGVPLHRALSLMLAAAALATLAFSWRN
jgi:phosphatidylglycerol:prolipoprotein diacylglycerol transferase